MKKHSYLLSILAVLLIISCKSDNDQPYISVSPYDTANKSIGGIMYDKFWVEETGFDQNNENLATIKANSDFFRCKQCHGWDGLGTKGAYISRAPKNTRPKVSGVPLYELAQTKTPQELFDGIKGTFKEGKRRAISYDLSTFNPEDPKDGNKMPNYAEILTDAQIWDIVRFLKEGMLDVNTLYDYTTEGEYPTGAITYANIGKNGNPEDGKAFFKTNCADCHGADGTKISLEGKSVGTFVRKKPYEVHHKITYGQPESTMKGLFNVSSQELQNVYKALTNATDFPDLPPKQ